MIKQNYRLIICLMVLAVITTASVTIAKASNNELLAIASKQSVNKKIAPRQQQQINNNSNIIDLKGITNISKTNPRITLSLNKSDIQPVLRMFADKAGLNIVFHNSAKGNVTLDLVNVPLNDAFRMVLQVAGLTYHLDGKTLIVSSQDFARSVGWSKQELNIVPVKYVDASMLANFLNQDIFSKNTPGLSNWDVVVTNATKNELMVFGTANDLAMVKKIVAKFDVPPLDTTFVVNHTTPAEMATLVCNMLRMTQTSTDSSSSSVRWDVDANSESGSSNSSTGFAANITTNSRFHFFSKGGIVTGFASSSGSSSSSGSGGSSSSSSGDGGIAIGKNVVACSLTKDGLKEGLEDESDSDEDDSDSDEDDSDSDDANNGSASGSSSIKMKSMGSLKMIVSYFPQRGTVNILGGSESQVKAIGEFIKKNDVKQPQAIMNIEIVEVTETGSKDLTSQWSFHSPNLTFTTAGSDGNTSINPILFGPDSDAWWSRPVGSAQLRWYINFLITNKKARTIANPKIIITNGEESKINLTDDYIQKVTAQLVQSASSTATTNVERTYEIGKDKGLQFTLIPFISPKGYISLNFSTEYSTLKGTQEAELIPGSGQELVATLLNRRTVDLKNVRIKDDETLIIGGLMKEEETKNVAKTPFLGDLPILGTLFRTTTTSKEKTELIILLTPKILKESEDINSSDNFSRNML